MIEEERRELVKWNSSSDVYFYAYTLSRRDARKLRFVFPACAETGFRKVTRVLRAGSTSIWPGTWRNKAWKDVTPCGWVPRSLLSTYRPLHSEGPSSSCENSDDSDDEHDNEQEAEHVGDAFAYAGAQAAQQAAQPIHQHEEQAGVAVDKQEDLAPYEGAAGAGEAASNTAADHALALQTSQLHQLHQLAVVMGVSMQARTPDATIAKTAAIIKKALGQALQPTTSWRISSRPEGSAGPRPSSARLDDRDVPPHHPEHGPTHGVTLAPAEGFASGPDEGPAGPRPSSALVDDRDLSLHPVADHDGPAFGPAFGPVEGHDEGFMGGLAEGLTDGPAKSPADCLAHGLDDCHDHPDPMHDAAPPAGSGEQETVRWGARRHRSPRKHRRVHFQARRAAQIVADPFRATDPDWAAATAWSNRADEPQGMRKGLKKHRMR